jgi:heme/copper-type cytochrome/quinol oxidase subunit 1
MSVTTNFSLARADFLRANSNVLTRLTMNTVLGSITFTTFAVLLPLASPLRGLDNAGALLIGVEGLLGMATVLFLLSVFAISILLMRLGTMGALTRQALVDGMPVIELEGSEKSMLTHACELSAAVVPLTSWGVGGLLASMLLIGFYAHVVVGALITATFVIVGFHLRKFWTLLLPLSSQQHIGSFTQSKLPAWIKDLKGWFARIH